ncbi:MAG: ABC transporter permease [Acidobacteria bacterium]|nr:ABC transporter permease [Acidobacteriota bacterium]
MQFFHDCWFVCWRELLHFLRSKISILASALQPLIWLLLVGNMFGRTRALPGFPARSYLDFMTPGVLAMVGLFAGAAGGMTVIWDRRVGYLNKLLALPISRASIVVGKMLAVSIRTSVQILIVLGVALALGVQSATGVWGIPFLLFFAVLLTFAFSGISITVGALVRQPETFWAVVNFLTVPLLFMSSALFPLEFMPPWLQTLARLNPVTYAIEPIRTLMIRGWEWTSIGTDLLIVVGFAAVVASISTSLFVRRVEISTL